MKERSLKEKKRLRKEFIKLCISKGYIYEEWPDGGILVYIPDWKK